VLAPLVSAVPGGQDAMGAPVAAPWRSDPMTAIAVAKPPRSWPA